MSEIVKYFDHTNLKPDATQDDIIHLCKEAKNIKCFSVCTNSCWTKTVSDCLKGSGVKTCTVIGFPLGACLTEIKAYETKLAVEMGAEEIDMVINVGKLKENDYDYVYKDIKAVCDSTDEKAIVKVIIEACLLTDKQKIKACEIALEAGAHFVKTSTGFSTGGASTCDIALMRSVVGDRMGVKASGGIRTYGAVKSMIKAGASRIGLSASIKILDEELHNAMK